MDSTPAARRERGLRPALALAFAGFVLLATLALLAWIEGSQRRESLRSFAETARTNARFVENLRLPRSPELARHLATILGMGVGFQENDAVPAGLPESLLPALKELSAVESGSRRMGHEEIAVATLDAGKTRLILHRSSRSPFSGNLDWVLPVLILTSLGAALAAVVGARIVRPLLLLKRWLPDLDRSDRVPLPVAVLQRSDEIGALARSLDETHRRLRDEMEKRRRSERLAALGRVATSLAHEVKNPAAAIRLHADLLADSVDPEDRASLDLIREEVDRISDLVNQWLFVARPEPPRRERRDLAELVRRVLDRLAVQFEHAGVSASFAGRDEVPAWIDEARIGQVLRNLLINAMQAMPEGGEIRVDLANRAAGAALTIRDGGPGFSAEALRRWREPFYSEREGGMGLGLTLAGEVMEAHGGAVEISNDPAGGAVVICHFAPAT